MTGGLEGKVALVTGAAQGIGAAIATRLAEDGATVVRTDRSAPAVADPSSLTLDVTSEADWADAVTEVTERFGRLDILVNNAGIYHAAPIADTSVEAFRNVLDVNATGVFLGMKACTPLLAADGGGNIVNISSVSGLLGPATQIAYAASKWAVRGMTKVAAKELARQGIRVNSVHPGQVDTEMNAIEAAKHPALVEKLIRGIPLGRIAQPAEVAAAVAFLASDDARYMSGAELAVDGALTF